MAATEDLLGQLHAHVANDLLRRLKSGEATHQELAQAIKFLKDNGIEATSAEDTKLRDIADSLPDFSADEPLHSRH